MAPIWSAAALLALVAILLLVAGVRATRGRALVRGGLALGVGLTLLAGSVGTGATAWALGRFEALTRETLAATIRIEPTGERRFRAVVDTGDGPPRRYELAGDELWVDARIVKWHPYANLLGLHTGYRLERIGGRYEDLDSERTAPRTVVALAGDDAADRLVDWAEDRAWLRPLVDAEYGSGSFAAADAPRTLEVRVSTTGLLIREVVPGAAEGASGRRSRTPTGGMLAAVDPAGPRRRAPSVPARTTA